MREAKMALALRELQTVRLICRQGATPCNGVVEVALDKLSKVRTCPVCGNGIQPDTSDQHYLAELAKVVGQVLASDKRYELEFVVTLPSDRSAPLHLS